MSYMSLPKRTMPGAGVLVVAAGLMAYGGWGFWQRYHATHNPHPVIPAAVVTHSTSKPDETPPTEACADYKVAAGDPRRIQIPALGVDGCVQKVGVDQAGAIAVPTNIYLAGWYVDSVLPGQPGISVIDGHVLGQYHDAIFSKLHTLQPGYAIRIQFGDESWELFQVVDVNSYPMAEVMNKLFQPLDAASASATSQLDLITCGGTYDRRSQSYDQRVVVRAKAAI